MKSGLYACAGASATASAAACAKRLDEPMTKESKVYFVLKPPLSGLLGWIRSTTGVRLRRRAAAVPSGSMRELGSGRLGDPQLDRPLVAGDVADRRADQAEEVALDPVAREIVRDAEHEAVTRELEALCLAEPGSVGRVVQCTSEPTGDFAPQALRSQLDLVLHPCCQPLHS